MMEDVKFDINNMKINCGFEHKAVLTEDYYEGKPLDFGNEPQLFLGDVVVEDVHRVFHEQQTPRLFSDKPLLVPEYPWEGRRFHIQCILYDEEEHIFKAWYGCRGLHEDPDQPSWEKNLPAGCISGVLCYAESDDMLNWRKPFFNTCPIGSVKESNIVFAGGVQGVGSCRVFLNPDKSDRSRKYVLIYGDKCGPRVAASADGRKFEDIPGINPIIPVDYDTHIHVMYDADRKKYQLYIRPSIFAKHESQPAEPVYPGLNYRRRITVTESSDLVHWSTPRIVTSAPEGAEYDQCDNENTFSVGGHILARLSRFFVKDVSDATNQKHVAWWTFGADPYHMKFLDSDEPMPKLLSADGSETIGETMIVGYPINANDKTYFPITARGRCNGAGTAGATLAEFRENGFIARVADEYGGWLLTREFYMRGKEIEVNCEVMDGGLVTAEILCGAGGCVRGGQFNPGYRTENCDPITESSVHAKLSFSGSADLSSFTDKAIYIRFHIVNAKLYAFKVNK